MVEHEAITAMMYEMNRLRRLLSHDYTELQSSDDDEEDQVEARNGMLRVAVHILRNMNQEILAQQLEKCERFFFKL